jgi:hypothetical protein
MLLARLLLPAALLLAGLGVLALLLTRLLIGFLALLARLVLILLVLAAHSGTPWLNLWVVNSSTHGLVAGWPRFLRRPSRDRTKAVL